MSMEIKGKPENSDILNLAVFLSGRGSNFEAILNSIDNGEMPAQVVLVISNNQDAGGLKIAGNRGIPTRIFNRNEFQDGESFANDMLSALRMSKVDFIALAGYMRKVPPKVIREFSGRILNIHPALLPKFGGKGMYGHYVHEAVLASGEKETGATVHIVDEIYDHGEILAQRSVNVYPDDTPETLAARVLEVEHKLYPEVIKEIAKQYIKHKKE